MTAVRELTVGAIAATVLEGKPYHLFIHGLGGARFLFAGGFAEAASRGLGVIALDLPGFGDSAALADGHAYSLAGHAGAVRAVLAELGVDGCYLALHSMSGALLPELLDGSVLGVTLLEANLTEEDADWSAEIIAMDDAAFDAYWSRITRHAKRIFGFQLHGQASSEQIADWARCFTMMDRRAFRETARIVNGATCGDGIVAALREFHGPKRYFRGASSAAWGGREGLAAMGVAYDEIENAGHYLFLDNPKALYPALYDGMSQ